MAAKIGKIIEQVMVQGALLPDRYRAIPVGGQPKSCHLSV